MIATRTFSTIRHRSVVAVAIWLTFALSTSRAELRLEAIDGDNATVHFAVLEGRLVDSHKQTDLPEDITWRLSGDLRANADLVELSPAQHRLHGQYPSLKDAGLPPLVYQIVTVFRDQSWKKEDYVDALLVHVWWQDGAVRSVIVAPARTARGRRGEVVGGAGWEINGATLGGHAFVLLWKDGAFVRPQPRIELPPARQIWQSLYLDDDATLSTKIANVSAADIGGRKSPEHLLHYALEADRAVAVPLLLAREQSADKRLRGGHTALMWGAVNDSVAAVEALRAGGAAIGMKSDGDRAFDLALGMANLSTAAALLDPSITPDVNALLEGCLTTNRPLLFAEIATKLTTKQRGKLSAHLQPLVEAALTEDLEHLRRIAATRATDELPALRIKWTATDEFTPPPASRLLILPRPATGISYIGKPGMEPERFERSVTGSTVIGMGSRSLMRVIGDPFDEPANQWAAVELLIGSDGAVRDVESIAASTWEMADHTYTSLTGRRFARPTLDGTPTATRVPLFVMMSREADD